MPPHYRLVQAHVHQRHMDRWMYRHDLIGMLFVNRPHVNLALSSLSGHAYVQRTSVGESRLTRGPPPWPPSVTTISALSGNILTGTGYTTLPWPLVLWYPMAVLYGARRVVQGT